jgi:hypothetical protein
MLIFFGIWLNDQRESVVICRKQRGEIGYDTESIEVVYLFDLQSIQERGQAFSHVLEGSLIDVVLLLHFVQQFDGREYLWLLHVLHFVFDAFDNLSQKTQEMFSSTNSAWDCFLKNTLLQNGVCQQLLLILNDLVTLRAILGQFSNLVF